jgi:hypothetical protein
MIPELDRKKWQALLTEQTTPTLHSLSLKLKLASLKAQIKIEHITLNEAVETLHHYCMNNKKMYTKDLENILG